MNIGLFGGTFDPIHRGHVNVARAAAERFKLKEVWFVPADIPPHKQKAPVTEFFHRYAMVSLALAGEKRFVPSLLEAPDCHAGTKARRPSYSIETVRRVKKMLSERDRLYFLIGMDAFHDISIWYKAEALLHECDFIVAARPGYSLSDIVNSLPAGLRPKDDDAAVWRKRATRDSRNLPGIRLHLLPETHEDVSATRIRAAIGRSSALNKLVPDAVAEYIRKEGLYKRVVSG
jgi:nicotinate-nucleotide adenylyltransferase